MARRKHRSQLDAIDEINMTPLIDLTFLLLIIFMITTPLLENSVDVSPPEMNASELPDKNSCSINLNRNGQIVFNKIPVTRQELGIRLAVLYEQNPKTAVLIRGDGERRYSEIMELMKTVKNAGLTNISLVTRAEGK